MATPNKVNEKWDSHTFYQTVSHHHLTLLTDGGDLIDLMLVECADSRWFIEKVSVKFESEHVFDAYAPQFIEPKFFANSDEAEKFACKLIVENTTLKFDEIYPYFED